MTCSTAPSRSGGSGGNAGRANRRGDSTGPVADRTPARAGSHWAAFPDAATGIPSRRENLSDRRADFAGESGSLALEPRADRGGSGVGGESPEVPPLRLSEPVSCYLVSQESHYWRQRYATPENRYRRQS